MAQPALSVILSNYNHARFVAQALETALSQSFRDIELLIVDDASTDDSVAIIERAIAGDPRVTFVRNTVNAGLLANTAKQIAAARGEYLHWYAADDYLMPGFYEAAVASLREHPEAGFCLGSYQRLHETNGRVEPIVLGWVDRPTYLSPADYVAAVARCGGTAIGLASVIRRRHMDAAGGVRGELRWYSDWFLLLTLALRHGACVLPQVVGTWRLLPTAYHASGSTQRASQHALIARVLDLLREPELQALIPLIRESGSLGDMGPYIISALLSEPTSWSVDNAALVASGVRARLRTRMDRLLRGARSTRH